MKQKTLYSQCNNYNQIRIVLFENCNISTYWRNTKNEYEKIHDRNINIMKELKTNGCAICGYDEYYGSLDFHHVNPKDKNFQISLGNLHRNDTNNELNKCILLCKNCHCAIHNRGN